MFCGVINGVANAEIIKNIDKIPKISSLQNNEIMDTIWSALMVLATIARIEQHIELFTGFANNNNEELALMLSVQKFCYKNSDYLTAFQQIIRAFHNGMY